MRTIKVLPGRTDLDFDDMPYHDGISSGTADIIIEVLSPREVNKDGSDNNITQGETMKDNTPETTDGGTSWTSRLELKIKEIDDSRNKIKSQELFKSLTKYYNLDIKMDDIKDGRYVAPDGVGITIDDSDNDPCLIVYPRTYDKPYLVGPRAFPSDARVVEEARRMIYCVKDAREALKNNSETVGAYLSPQKRMVSQIKDFIMRLFEDGKNSDNDGDE